MSDKFFEEVDWFQKKFGGENPVTDDEMSHRFALHGPERRIAMLHQIESDDSEITDLRKSARSMNLKRRLNSEHQLLLKAGR